MAFAFKVQGSQASDKTAGTSITVTYDNISNQNANVGDIVIVGVAKDNDATADAQTNEITSVTDSKGNLYRKAAEFCNAQGAANAGAVVAVFFSKLTVQLVDAVDTITANFSSSKTASAITVNVYTGEGVCVAALLTLANDNADVGSMNLTMPNAEHLWVRMSAKEGIAGSWTKTAAYGFNFGLAGTSGGGAATNMSVMGESDIFTGTSNPSDPTWTANADHASVLVAFQEHCPRHDLLELRQGRGFI